MSSSELKEFTTPPRPERKTLNPYEDNLRCVLQIIRDRSMHAIASGERELDGKHILTRDAKTSSIEEVRGPKGMLFWKNWQLVGIVKLPEDEVSPILFYQGKFVERRGFNIKDIVVHDHQASIQWALEHPDAISRFLNKNGFGVYNESKDKAPVIHEFRKFAYQPIERNIIHAGFIEQVNQKERKI